MGGASSNLTHEFARANEDGLEIACELSNDAAMPAWTTNATSTLTIFADRDTELAAGVLTTVKTGVALRLPFGLVALAVPCEDLGSTVTLQTAVFCSERPRIVLQLTHRPARDVDAQTLHVSKHASVARLLIMPLARPVLKVATRTSVEVSGKIPEGVAEAAAGAAACHEPAAVAPDVV